MNTIILTHADGDGICAGAIALSKFPDAKIFFTKPVSLYRDLQSLEANRFIITDIALTKKDASNIVKLLKKKSAQIFYFDHHPMKPEIKTKMKRLCKVFQHNSKVSASEIIYKYYQKEIPRERVWAAIYGAIADYKEDTNFIHRRIKNWDKRALYFEVSILVLGIKVEQFDSYVAKRKIVTLLAKGGNPSDVFGLIDAAKLAVGLEFKLYEFVKKTAKSIGDIAYVEGIPSFGFRGPAALFSATVKNKPLGVCVFHRKNHIDITIRARDSGLLLNKLAEYAAEKVGGSGGGHPAAAGARIGSERLIEFLEELDKLMKK